MHNNIIMHYASSYRKSNKLFFILSLISHHTVGNVLLLTVTDRRVYTRHKRV